MQLTLSLGDEPGSGGEVATGLPEMTTDERMRAELEILGLDVTQHVVTPYSDFLDALGITRSQDLLKRRSRSELLVAGVKVATQTPPIRSGRRVIFLTLDDSTGPVDCTFFEDAQGPYAATVFHSWLLVVRGELRRTGRRGVSLRATGAWELPALHAVWQRARTSDDAIADVRAELARVPEGYTEAGEGPPSPGVAACSSTPAASRCRPTPTSSRPAIPPRTSRGSCGTAAPGVRDERDASPTRVCCMPGPASPSERRQSVRSGVVWTAVQGLLADTAGEPARIVDVGGGTGGFAVPLAQLGHRVEVIDPSPDALAALDRRAREADVADRITGQQGDLADLATLVDEADLVLCHGVLDVVDDPAAALATIASVLRPGGHLSLLVAQRHAAVVARAMAGHFQAARDLLDDPTARAGARGGHRFTLEELEPMLTTAGLSSVTVHGVRVFADLVPGSLLDLEPGASAALIELESAVSTRSEFLPLATQLHVLARR